MARFAAEVQLRAFIRNRRNGKSYDAKGSPSATAEACDFEVESLDTMLLEGEAQADNKSGDVVLVFELAPGFTVSIFVERLTFLKSR